MKKPLAFGCDKIKKTVEYGIQGKPDVIICYIQVTRNGKAI